MHHKHSFRRKLQTFFLSLLLVLLTVAGVPSAAYTAEAASADTTMAVHFLDVGQGLSILVQSQGQNLLYDGGDRGHSSFVVSYLQKQNISIIDYMISSHYDEDHVAGLVGCSGQLFRKKCDRRGLCAGYEDLSVFRKQCCLSGINCAASGTRNGFHLRRREIYGAFSSIDQQQR